MNDIRKNAETVRDECLRRAKKAREEGDIEMADIYMQMAQAETETVVFASDARPKKFTGKASGSRSLTEEKKKFLARVASEIGTKKRDAVAAEAVASHPTEVRRLWHSKGKPAESKILNFLRNHRT